MLRKISFIVMVLALGLLMAIPAFAAPPAQGGRAGTDIKVYVTSQELVYESIVTADLPPHGPFQKLEMDGPTGLQTEFGPGDRGYVGGRWWVDVNENGEMDGEDAYFLCPLLGPGQELSE
jgi:hypothetical protein